MKKLTAIFREHVYKTITYGWKWTKLRKQVIAERGSCQFCGNTKDLEVHHIMPKEHNPSLLLEKNNLLVLCSAKGKECHLLFGHGNSFRYFNPKVFLHLDQLKQGGAEDYIIFYARQSRKKI